MWAEIRTDYYDSITHVTLVDAWLTDDDNEEGKVIALVGDDGNVTYLDNRARTDAMAQETIRNLLAEIGNRGN